MKIILPSSIIPSFIKLPCLVTELTRDPDLNGQTDGRKEDKPIVPSGDTGRGLITYMHEPSYELIQCCMQMSTGTFSLIKTYESVT